MSAKQFIMLNQQADDQFSMPSPDALRRIYLQNRASRVRQDTASVWKTIEHELFCYANAPLKGAPKREWGDSRLSFRVDVHNVKYQEALDPVVKAINDKLIWSAVVTGSWLWITPVATLIEPASQQESKSDESDLSDVEPAPKLTRQSSTASRIAELRSSGDPAPRSFQELMAQKRKRARQQESPEEDEKTKLSEEP
jgi:hypothetical protein